MHGTTSAFFPLPGSVKDSLFQESSVVKRHSSGTLAIASDSREDPWQ